MLEYALSMTNNKSKLPDGKSLSKNHSKDHPKSNFLNQVGESQSSQEVLGGNRFVSMVVFGILVLLTIVIGVVLYQRSDREYGSELVTAIGKLTKVNQGMVKVVAHQSDTDITVKTSFIARQGKQQQIESVLDYSESGYDFERISLLSTSDSYYVELPLGDRTKWVKLGGNNDASLLNDIGYPVEILVGEDAHTPLLPFGNFEDDLSGLINKSIRKAFKDAVFVRADQGKLEYQVELTKQEVTNIIDATARSAQPMDATAIVDLFGDKKSLNLTVQVDRKTKQLKRVKVTTDRDGEDVNAKYDFSYDLVQLRREPTDAISVDQFVDLSIKQND